MTLIFGSDETIPEAIGDQARRVFDETLHHHHPEAQRLFRYRHIVAAMTTSVHEAQGLARNWGC